MARTRHAAANHAGTAIAASGRITVRITILSHEAPRRIAVEGRLTAAEIGELDLSIGDDASGVCMELQNLLSADRAGLAALRRARAEGALLVGVPPHIAWRLEGDPG